MKRLLAIVVLALTFTAGAQESHSLGDALKGGVIQGAADWTKGKIDQYTGVDALSRAEADEMEFLKAKEIAEIQNPPHDWMHTLVVYAGGLVTALILFLILGNDRARGWLSASYRHTQLTRNILDTYEKAYSNKEVEFKLDQNKSILLGLSNIAWAIFGGLAFFAIISGLFSIVSTGLLQ